MHSLYKYFMWTAIIPLALVAITGIVLAATHDGSNYKSEWSTNDGFGLTIFLMVIVSLLITALSYTMFLNKWKAFNQNSFISGLAWLLLPGIACLIIIRNEWMNFNTRRSELMGGYDGNRLLDGYILGAAILHLFVLTVGFIHYRKHVIKDKDKN